MKVLDGKVAVITGGGSGIGVGVARACGAAGMAVAVVDLDVDRASVMADELSAAETRAAAFAADVSDADAVDALAAEVFDRFGGCHLLLNNAGLCPLGRSWDHSAAEWSHVVGVNLMGVVNGVNAFVPAAPRAGRGGPHREHRIGGRARLRAFVGAVQRHEVRGRGIHREPARRPRALRHRRERSVSRWRRDQHRRHDARHRR